MPDPLMEEYRATRCPEGSRAEIDLDESRIGCFTPEGTEVPALSEASLGVVGWAAILAGSLALFSVLYRRYAR